jgi:hypothetical protein
MTKNRIKIMISLIWIDILYSLLPQRRPNFALNAPQPIVRLATIAVVHHQIINANFVRFEDISI